MFLRKCLQIRSTTAIGNYFLLSNPIAFRLQEKHISEKLLAFNKKNLLPALDAFAPFSSSVDVAPPPVPVATYAEVRDLPNHPEILLIDVREPSELKETGQVPTSINVPLVDVPKAFAAETSPEKFETLYGHAKPSKGDAIIVMCRSGRRSEVAAQSLVVLGFTKVKNYRGSWLEWAEKNGLPQ